MLRPLLWIILLVGGFLAGAAWRTSDAPSSSTSSDPTEVNTNTPKKVTVNNEDQLVPASPEPENPLLDNELHTIKLFEASAPSVCFITTTNVRRDVWSRNITEIPRGNGSGFIWDMQGHIITNYHVIQGADRAQVTLGDQTTWDAELIGVAPDKDLAVLRIEAPKSSLRPIPIGSSDNLLVGQSVFAIGNPFGLDQTLTTGIVSALGREIKSVSGIPIREVIQTDAAINPGNSGGPLLDSGGKLIGVNTAIYSPSGASAGIGFSIPVNIVRWVVPELIEHGRIKRPSLGITVTQTSVIKRYNLDGPLVRDVEPNSAAERAGLRPTTRDNQGNLQLGDIIIQMDQQNISTYEDLILALEKYQPGDEIILRLKRNDREIDVALVLDAS